MNPRKSIGPLLALLLLVGVAFAIRYSMRDPKAAQPIERITVGVLAGSGKENFLNDSELTKILDSQGITIRLEKAGSREMANRPDLKAFDAAYPTGAQAAAKIARTTGAKSADSGLYSPIAVASWRTLLPALEKSGLVSKKDGYYVIDMAKLVDTMQKGTRWKDLPGNTAYAAGKSLLIDSADVRTSTSGGMYLSLASWAANGRKAPDDDADADKVADGITSLFVKQGYPEPTSAGIFEDYAAMGIGKAPLAMIYEQQFLEYELSHTIPNPDMVLLYPMPTILTKDFLVALSDHGTRFTQAMTSNAKIASIAQRYGFRTQTSAELIAAAQAKNLVVPPTIADVIDPPSYDILEKLIGRIDAALTSKEF